MQVAPIKPPLKPPGIKRLNLNYNILPSTFGFRFNVRRFNKAAHQCPLFAVTFRAHAGYAGNPPR